ncbi:DNA-binding protein rif1 [Maudiozyma exigua]|uniref:DNA-binding protein rif1 n=1 Tax=Maudiozyma exigua TaxID=34358 RepID=A0A9P6W9P0_MAUEX|nr:DNA-binding protein rif1 [Kazachstania exigua]
MSKSKKLIDRVQGYTMDNIPKGPRLTRSTKNNKRAIDTLEQKLNQISKNQKDGRYSPNAQPVFMGSSYSPIGSRNTGHRIIPNDGGISPTPKRRRRNDNEIETRNKINKLPILPRSKNNNSSINSSREDNADTRLIHSSPIRKKNVKFADKLEASLNNNSNIRSSPIRKPPHYPIKSILRRTNYAMNDSPPRKPRSLIVAEEEDNSTVNYAGELAAFWSAGNIHEMSDPNNFDEYKDFIMKGLEYLEKESCPRRYEIYGTFNKIIPVTPVHIVANTIKDRKSSLNDKKIIFLNENLDRLMPIVTRDMKSVSAKEDEHFVLNSIFVSRSNGIIMEKLSLIKALLQRYPDEMLDQICDWFPRGILFRILMSTSSASQEILVMSTMILRDVVMMRTDKFLKDDSFFRCIEIDSPKFTIPRDVIERLVKQNSQIYEDETYTWGSLIRLQSKFLLTERQFETVSELWSLMVKLLYDQKCDSISQLRFSREQFSEWLDLNRIFFLNANNQMVIRFLIDMWQNVILVLWNSTFSLPSSAKLVTEIVNIIQTPFQRLISSKRLEYIFGALEPLLLKLYSFFWKASYSEDNHSLMRFNTWSKVMGEILLLCFRSGVSSTQVLVTKLIHRALDLDYRQPSTHPLEINTLRGVAQLPSTLEDMTCLSPIFYSQTFHMMLQLLDECIQVTADSSIYKADCEVPLPFAPQNFDLFYSLIEVLKSHNLGGEIRKLIIRHISMVDTVKFLELDLLPNYAPKNIRTNIIMNLNEMDIDEQSRIIKIYLYQDADLLLKSGTVGIENYIKSKTVFSMDERTALRDILIECHDRQMFTVGNRLINILLSKQINSVVEEFFHKYQKEDDIFFNIDTLSAIVSKINACREDGLQILTGIIQKGDEEIDFIILDNILKQDNTIIFKPCVNTLFAIFLNEPSPDNNRNYKHLFETFKKWIKLILTADKNTQIIFMEGFGESLSRYPINKDNAKYVKQFIDQLEFGKKFRDLESARNIQDIFNNWDSLKNSIPRTESSNHSGSTILTPGGLNDSGNDKKLHPVEKNIIPSSVKDTKDSYTSLISNSETISSIDDVDLKITPNKQIESSENPSTLPEVSVGSNKDLSQQYLAKSTQLEQKKDNTSDMISNEINTIIIEHKSPSREKLTKQYKNENILENENLDEEKEFIKKMESTNEREDHENEENEEMFTLKDGYLQTKYPKLNSTTDTKAHSDSENDESDDPDVKSESEEEMIKMSDTINAILSPVTSAEKKAELRTAETEVNTGISTRLDNVDAVVNPDSSNIVISPIMGVSLDTTPDENTINNSLINGIHTQKEVSSASIDLMVKLEDPENISSLSGNDKEHPIAIVLDSDSDSLDDIENLDASKNMQDDLVNADSAVTQEVMPLNHDLAKRETEDTTKLMDKESLGNSTNPNDKIDTSDNELNQDDENLGTSANPEDDIMEKKFTAVKDEVVKKITQLPQIQSDDFFRVQDDNEPDMDEDENKSNSNKMPMGIKIPIFNFRKRVAPTIPLNRYSPKRRSLRYANSNTVINVNIPKTVRRPASPEPIIRHPTMNEGFSNDLVLSDLSGHDSVTSVASLTDRLPTKKARKLVSRIRSISRNDLAFLSAAERKTMRMEMLDFLMKLEHESTND